MTAVIHEIRTLDALASEMDQICCADIRNATYFAVAAAYRNWYDLSEEEVVDLLEKEMERAMENGV